MRLPWQWVLRAALPISRWRPPHAPTHVPNRRTPGAVSKWIHPPCQTGRKPLSTGWYPHQPKRTRFQWRLQCVYAPGPEPLGQISQIEGSRNQTAWCGSGHRRAEPQPELARWNPCRGQPARRKTASPAPAGPTRPGPALLGWRTASIRVSLPVWSRHRWGKGPELWPQKRPHKFSRKPGLQGSPAQLPGAVRVPPGLTQPLCCPF